MTPNGAAIRAIREARELDLRRLAHLIGKSPSFLSRVETGKRGAADGTLARIADELHVPLEAILKGDLP